ncbi:hypothetical protein [Streptosporangium saharense]|uniref:Uncharacterized protein n=1 Tax=Streptosporangium saharense TaxID=1706840 RepID=A0A7W7QSP5_9ACTN|nr:hypothetical protein [Streptosporangium saharense]MBB4919100.1 hypothetical protein [Streptosporangium saharense]
MSTDTQRRTAFIGGLRDLAFFLEANPAVPVPTDSTIVTYYPEQGTDDDLCAEIDRIAALCGTSVDLRLLPLGLYTISRCFGPVHVEWTAILSIAKPPHGS